MNKYKHHDVILAYLNGDIVQINSCGTEGWNDIPSFINNSHFFPSFNILNDYRIKPKEEMSKLHIERDTSGIHTTHATYTDSQDVNLRLFWLDNKLVRAEVV